MSVGEYFSCRLTAGVCVAIALSVSSAPHPAVGSLIQWGSLSPKAFTSESPALSPHLLPGCARLLLEDFFLG